MQETYNNNNNDNNQQQKKSFDLYLDKPKKGTQERREYDKVQNIVKYYLYKLTIPPTSYNDVDNRLIGYSILKLIPERNHEIMMLLSKGYSQVQISELIHIDRKSVNRRIASSIMNVFNNKGVLELC